MLVRVGSKPSSIVNVGQRFREAKALLAVSKGLRLLRSPKLLWSERLLKGFLVGSRMMQCHQCGFRQTIIQR